MSDATAKDAAAVEPKAEAGAKDSADTKSTEGTAAKAAEPSAESAANDTAKPGTPNTVEQTPAKTGNPKPHPRSCQLSRSSKRSRMLTDALS